MALLLFVVWAGALAADPVVRAFGKFEPPDGSVYTGADVDQQPEDTAETSKAKWDEWTSLMDGKPAALSHTFTGFDTWTNADCQTARRRNATPLISWQTGGTTPKVIAEAGATAGGVRTDELLLRNGWLLAVHQDCQERPVFLRIDHEMNAYWSDWGSYDQGGDLKEDPGTGGVSFTPEDYKRMWRRMVIVLRGGYVRDINAALAAEGLPPLDPAAQLDPYMRNNPDDPDDDKSYMDPADPDSYVWPADNVAFVWNPLDRPGQPDVSGNRWLDYYPGDAYVDWVGQTSYNTTWNSGSLDRRFAWLDDFYEEFSVRRGKPYMLGEWGLDPNPGYASADNPAYIDRMLEWAEGKPKVKALVYFSVLMEDGGDFRLSSYPRSAKVLAAGFKGERFLGDLTSVDSGPSYTVRTRDATLTFSSPEAALGHEFECSMDGSAFARCSSPVKYSDLADGLHVFKVRTNDSATPGEPAVRSWNVTVPKPTGSSSRRAPRG